MFDKCLTQLEAKDLLKYCLEDGRIIQGRHFREELAKEQVTFLDVMAVLKSGRIFNAPELDTRSGEWNYRIEGHEPGGKWLCIVFSFKTEDTSFLITVFSVSAKSK